MKKISLGYKWNYGRHKGKTIKEIADTDYSYALWVIYDALKSEPSKECSHYISEKRKEQYVSFSSCGGDMMSSSNMEGWEI